MLGDTDDLLQSVEELAKRAKIYELMQETLGMQHGESFTILNPEVRAKYLKEGLDSEGGETLLAATPQRRLMTTYFDDKLSTLEGGPNGDLIDGYRRTYFEGLVTELLSPPRTLNLLTITELRRLNDKFRNITGYFGLSIFGRMAGLVDGDVEPELDRAGPALQPGADGGVQEYVPPAAGGPLTEAAQFPGAAGGTWNQVAKEVLLASGPVGLRPWTYIDGRVGPGDTAVPALPFESMGLPASSPYFEPGDVVVVDPGGADEELVTLATVAPMTFTEALVNKHEWGTMVLLAYPEGGAASGSLVTVVPARVLETRSGSFAKTVDGLFLSGGRVAAGSTLELLVAGRGGVDAGASAVMLNVTAVRPSGTGWVTVFPCGSERPNASSVNYVAGVVTPNAVLAKVGAGGKVCLYSEAETDLLVDVNGFVPAGGSVATVVPARVLETRSGSFAKTVDGLFLSGGRVAAGSTLELLVAGRGGVDAGASAVMLNVTAVRPSGTGWVTVFPCGSERPNASSVNYVAGVVTPNAVLAKVGAGGKVCLYSEAETDLLVDVNGFVPAGGSVATVVPARVLETRSGSFAKTVDGLFLSGGRVAAGSTLELLVAGRGGVDAGASAVMLNVTAVRPSGTGWVTVFPCGSERPNASSVNYVAGVVTPNAVLAKVGAGGKVCLYSEAQTDLLVDVNAYVP